MSLEPKGNRMPRKAREQRAYALVMTGGAAGLVFGAGFVLALFGTIGFGLPLVALIVAVVCLLLFRRTVSS